MGRKKKFLLGLAIALLCVASLFFLTTCRRKAPIPIEGAVDSTVKQVLLQTKNVLKSSIAGSWYSNDANTLSKEIEGYFQKAEAKPLNDVIALISPHAGYQYSGQTAVMGIKSAAKQYRRIIVIGPSHRVPMEEVLIVPRATHYQTPLGEVELDVEFINKLLEHPVFQYVPDALEYEHSAQIQVPLLQYSQKNFKLVPIVAGHCSFGTITKAGRILKGLTDEGTLVVASSDFTHYGTS